MKFLYENPFGRLILKLMLTSGVLNLGGKFLKSGLSKGMIKRYIKKYNIDMDLYENRKFKSFADFFGREKLDLSTDEGEDVFISPCDGLLSVVDITEDARFSVKGIEYSLEEFLPNMNIDEQFRDGLFMIFRLEARDYHHFCYVDDCIHQRPVLIPGKLHSVQPLVLERVPIFRNNKRYFHMLETAHFGNIMQVEVGAVFVGDVSYIGFEDESLASCEGRRGAKSGNFELLGSTIVLILTEEMKHRLSIDEHLLDEMKRNGEAVVKYGRRVGSVSGR